MKGLIKYESLLFDSSDREGTAVAVEGYRKFFRDKNCNPLQHTVEKLSKMGARFLLLEPGQLRIPRDEIPTSILSKMPEFSQQQQQNTKAE